MKIVVTGASGFLGKRLLPALVAQGHDIFALVRSEATAVAVRAMGASAIKGDLAAPPFDLPACDAVVHAAAHFRFSGPRRPFEVVNIEGTRALLHAAKRAGAKRFIYVSAAAVVMDDKGSAIADADEAAPTYPHSFSAYIATKAAAETLVLGANAPGFATIALRPPGIWGAGDAFSETLPAMVKRGMFGFIGGGRFPCVTCHVDNVVEAITCTLERGNGGHAYFINDSEPTTLRHFLIGVGAALGLSVEKSRALPYGVAMVLSRVMESVAWITRSETDPPMTRTMVRLIGRPFTTRDAKARAELGYIGHVSRSRGLKDYAAPR